VKGEIVMRGADGFEAAVKTVQATLEEAGRPTASKEIHEALEALSWRPEPDLRGAIYHTPWVLSNAWPARLPAIPEPL
jgi:hypothetical protein